MIAWCGFLGAWLLVAGPIYQAAQELADEEFEREDMERLAGRAEAPPPASRWWLLLPPVAYVLHRRRREAHRRAMIKATPRAELEKLMHYGETASAWLFVASGAFLIAIKETWELREAHEWSSAIFYVLIVVMLFLCVGDRSLCSAPGLVEDPLTAFDPDHGVPCAGY